MAKMQPKSVLTLAIVALTISLAGSIIFVLTTPPQSYILFFLFLPLAALITLSILGKMLVLRVKLEVSGIELYVFLVLASITLTILQLANIYVETINAILYVIVFIFGLGFSLLSILKFKPSFSRIEFLALAYPLSIASLGIFGSIALILPAHVRGIAASTIITLLSTTTLLMKRKERQTEEQKHHELVLKNNELILVLALITSAYFFTQLYPQIARFTNADIAGNFLQALVFAKDTLGNSNIGVLYPLFGIYQSSMIYIVRPSIETFQVTMISLNILALLSFYGMASQYLKRYGDHTPAIATLFWGTFAGFGWLNILSNRIVNPSMPLLSLIGQADAFSYGDVTWRRLFFYLSMEVTFTLVFATLYFLKRNDLSRTKQVTLMTLLITPIPLMHPYGTYLLLPVLLCFAIICTQELRQQLKYTAYSLIAASFASLLLNYILGIEVTGIPVNILAFSEYLMVGLAIIALTFRRDKTPRKPNSLIKRLLDKKYILPVVTLLMLLYLAFLLLWLSGGATFNFGSLNRVGYVPSFLYPAKFGIMGVLAIVALYILFANPKLRSKELVALLASVLLVIFVSRLLSTIQMQYASEFTFSPNSWLSETIRQTILNFREERMFELFKVPLAILASIALGKHLLIKTRLKKANLLSYLAVSGLVSLVLISGMASTFSGLEYYHDLTNPLSSSERDIINKVQNSILTNGRAIMITPGTPTANQVFTGASVIVTESPAAWASKSPELPLFVTRYSETTPTYIYLQKPSDYQELSKYAGNYLEHLSNTAQTFLENQEVQIEVVNNGSIPIPQSSTTLVIPYDESKMEISKPLYQESYMPYQVLSLYFEKKHAVYEPLQRTNRLPQRRNKRDRNL